IVEQSVLLIFEIGFEQFTFKKLGEHIDSNESSIYRYFENKHKLLLYLSCWYWSWMEYLLLMQLLKVSSKHERLDTALNLLTQPNIDLANTTHIPVKELREIIINEFTKSYLTKTVDKENEEGFFFPYKRFVLRFAEIFERINSDYAYPRSLASSVVEGVFHQQFVRLHFKSITDMKTDTDLKEFYKQLILKTLS
ncbi:MAG: helix-turn-helix domain-containing protein, partial [Flavobacteriaceae bacterium]|nr:helix-turn-helix domain-containing protein [Flavobacteriaceae bacterium]